MILHLWDSIRIYRKHRSPGSSHGRRRTIGDLAENVFNIPLQISHRQSTLDGNTGGIQVTQLHEIRVEGGGERDEKDSLKAGIPT